jgi:CubicO group peptidase (beta-lactamase class C family)
VRARRLPGAVVAIKRRGAGVTFLSAGAIAFDSAAPAGPDTLFRIYSMTKPIVAMAIMGLIEQGRLALDQKIDGFLPEFGAMRVWADGDRSRTRPAAGPITVRHLLTHTAGFSYHVNGGRPLAALYRREGIAPGSRSRVAGPGQRAPVRTLDELAARLAPLPLDFDPGTRWQYSVSFDLLGLLIERLAGQSLDLYLRQAMFEPLGMVDTDFIAPPEKVARLSSLYEIARPQTGDAQRVAATLATVSDDRRSSAFARDRDLPSGGGGLVSTAGDYARFCAMALNGGALGGRRLFKPETIAQARSNLLPPGVAFSLDGYLRNGFGAGVEVIVPGGETPGGAPAGSYGWTGAAGTTMWIDPGNDAFVILMVQFSPSGAYPIDEEVSQAAYADLAAADALIRRPVRRGA